MWIIKELGFYYERYYGPYKTKEKADASKPKDRIRGSEEGNVRYRVFLLDNPRAL